MRETQARTRALRERLARLGAILAALLASALTGCGGQGSGAADDDAGVVTDASSQSEEPGADAHGGADASADTEAVDADSSAEAETDVETLPDCTLFVSPIGSDDGRGTEAEPWATVKFAVGQLHAGDTLCLRAGVYREGNIDIAGEGTAEFPVTVRSYPGERAVVTGSLEAYETPGNRAWELVDPAIGLYRSVASESCGSGVRGKFEHENTIYSLVVYPSEDAIRNTEQCWTAAGLHYMGPGIYCDPEGERIYIRLEPPSEEALDGRVFRVPADPDPAANRIFLSSWSNGITFAPTAAHVRLHGFDLAHHGIAIRPAMGTHDLTLTDLTLTPGSIGIVVGDDVPGEPIRRVLVDGVAFHLGLPEWIAWTDIKGGERPAGSLKLGGVTFAGGASEVEIRNCVFDRVFDGITATASVPGPVDHLHAHHNSFVVMDDALQLCTSAFEIEFDHNTTRGPGPSHHGCGSSAFPGTKYMHHNVIAPTEQLFWGRCDPDQLLEPEDRGWRYHVPFPSHDWSSAGDGDPWKIYHNTVLFFQTTTLGAGEQRFGPSATGVLHEVLNNIFVQHSDHWASRGAHMEDGSTIYDGNLWYRPVPGPTKPLLGLWIAQDESLHDFDSLAEFRGSTFFLATQGYYPPGWEASGIEADPRLDAEYRPAADGPAATGAIDLGDKGWPGVEGERFRGALAPARE